MVMFYESGIDDIMSADYTKLLERAAVRGPYAVKSANVDPEEEMHMVTGEPCRNESDGMQCYAGLRLPRVGCSSMPMCPVPASIPKIDVKKGTTTLGFVFQGGIILAVDSRASSGQYIASQTVLKVLVVNDFIMGTMAGGAADCQYWQRFLGMECRLWELRNGRKITVAAASKILANITYSYRNHGLSMGTMVAGCDSTGPNLYYVDDQGTRIKHNVFSVGSGSVYAYGVLDSGFKHDMSTEAAADLGRKAVFHATHRDGASGGFVSVYHLHSEGWTKISRDDQTKLFPKYMAHTM